MTNCDARPTLDEIRTGPPTITVTHAAAALGISRGYAYECVRLGTFPARTLKVGKRTVVVTKSLVDLLDGEERS